MGIVKVTYLEEVVLSVLIGVVSGLRDIEGRSSGQHLVGENAQRPPVDAEAVLLPAQYLRGDVVGRTAEGRRRIAWSDALLERWGDMGSNDYFIPTLCCTIFKIASLV